MPAPPFLRAAGSGFHLAVRLQPRASRNEICGVLGEALKIKVTAPPVDAAANQALVRFLATILGCPKSAVRIVRGHTSRHKTIEIQGLPAGQIAERLLPQDGGGATNDTQTKGKG